MLLLTKQNLRKLYACFVKLPPFCNYRMPAAHKVTFKVINDPDTYGWFINDPATIEMSTLCEDFNKINETLLHEMAHCMLWYNGHKDFDRHDAKFRKIAEIICRIYKYNIEEF